MTRPSARTAWLTAAGILVLAAVVALTSIVRGDFSDTDGRILGTLALCLYCGGTAFAGLSLVERGARAGWLVVATALAGFAVVLPGIWQLADESGDGGWSVAWLGLLATLAALVSATAWLIARGRSAGRLAGMTCALAICASGLSFAVIRADGAGDGLAKAVAVLWTLTVLAYALTPVVARVGDADETEPTRRPAEAAPVGRVLATLDGVELVVTSAPDGIDPLLGPGDRVELRRRASAVARDA